LTGEERIYISARIIRISGIDKFGNPFQFYIGMKIKTAYEKLVEAWSRERNLYALALSPVALSVVDASGKRTGYYQGQVYEEIVGAYYSGPESEIQLIIVPNPEGTYSAEVEGLENGTYTLLLGYIREGDLALYKVEKERGIQQGIIHTYEIITEELTRISPEEESPLMWTFVWVAVAVGLGAGVSGAAVTAFLLRKKS